MIDMFHYPIFAIIKERPREAVLELRNIQIISIYFK